MGADQDGYIVAELDETTRSAAPGIEGGVFQGVQGATVLHCLARLYRTTIQGATQGATKCYTGCYIFPSFKESGLGPWADYAPKAAKNPVSPVLDRR
jgi:hypothetical protein